MSGNTSLRTFDPALPDVDVLAERLIAKALQLKIEIVTAEFVHGRADGPCAVANVRRRLRPGRRPHHLHQGRQGETAGVSPEPAGGTHGCSSRGRRGHGSRRLGAQRCGFRDSRHRCHRIGAGRGRQSRSGGCSSGWPEAAARRYCIASSGSLHPMLSPMRRCRPRSVWRWRNSATTTRGGRWDLRRTSPLSRS